MIKVIDKSLCCGCNACVQRCPKHCIHMQADKEGFLYPKVKASQCIDCGLCEKVCPMSNSGESELPLNVIAAKNRNDEQRHCSSSGGIFIQMAHHVILNGGVVFGAVYDSNWQIYITHSVTIEGIHSMMGSKYVQANVGDSYCEAEHFLKSGREVLFTGTPCQIAGLKRYLYKDYPNLLAVDVICHGVPSPKVWHEYIKEITEGLSTIRVAVGKNSVLSSSLNVVPAIAGIEFRDKSLHGWKKYSFVVRGKSDLQADKNTVLLSDIHNQNLFMKGFLSDLYLRPSCYSCVTKDGKSKSDITLGDFWGIDRVMPDFDDDKGCSVVVVHSKKGMTLLNQINIETRETSLDNVLKYNPSYRHSVRMPVTRSKFFKKFIWLSSMRFVTRSVFSRSMKTAYATPFILRLKTKIWLLLHSK